MGYDIDLPKLYMERGKQSFENDPVVFVFLLIFTVGEQESDENDKK